MTKVGDDETGRRMLTYLEEEGIATDAVVVDMVKPKKGETIEGLKPLCPYMDYFLPNAEELTMLSAGSAFDATGKLLEYGVKHVVLKGGSDGWNCIIRRAFEEGFYRFSIPPFTNRLISS